MTMTGSSRSTAGPGRLDRRGLAALAGKAAVVVGVGSTGWWLAVHGVAGVTWGDVLAVVRSVVPWRLGLLAAVWLAGLGIYSLVLSAALPGLGVRRGLLLNMTGSAVANAVPLGGAVATGLNWRMTRLWGHSDDAFITYCLVTNLLDIGTKLVLPLVAAGVLVAVSAPVPATVGWVAVACLAALVVIAGLAGTARGGLRRDASRLAAWGAALRRLQEGAVRAGRLLRRRWPRLLPASAGYIAAQVALLVLCLRAVGLDAPFSIVLMAAAIERLGTLVPITPGGTGVAEIGTVAWLVSNGLDPTAVVAGVLLYRVFLIAMEIPVGGALLGGWLWRRRASTRGLAVTG